MYIHSSSFASNRSTHRIHGCYSISAIVWRMCGEHDMCVVVVVVLGRVLCACVALADERQQRSRSPRPTSASEHTHACLYCCDSVSVLLYTSVRRLKSAHTLVRFVARRPRHRANCRRRVGARRVGSAASLGTHTPTGGYLRPAQRRGSHISSLALAQY